MVLTMCYTVLRALQMLPHLILMGTGIQQQPSLNTIWNADIPILLRADNRLGLFKCWDMDDFVAYG